MSEPQAIEYASPETPLSAPPKGAMLTIFLIVFIDLLGFGLLLPLPWLGAKVDRLAIVALALYALLPIVRNTYVGIAGISQPVREAAVAMGLTSRQLLWLVELPLASPVILAGIRVATVITIGVATIAAAIGAGGLGEFIFRGIAMVDNGVILAGAIPAALMALLADFLLGGVEKLLARRQH